MGFSIANSASRGFKYKMLTTLNQQGRLDSSADCWDFPNQVLERSCYLWISMGFVLNLKWIWGKFSLRRTFPSVCYFFLAVAEDFPFWTCIKKQGWTIDSDVCNPNIWRAMYLFAALSVLLTLFLHVWGLGNPQCWTPGFTYELCCDVKVYGAKGNVACWDPIFSYETCCVTKTKVEQTLPAKAVVSSASSHQTDTSISSISVSGNRGNPDCWTPGFTYELCCDVKHGVVGNTACWDQVYSYEKCCVSKTKIETPHSPFHYKSVRINRESAVIRERRKAQQEQDAGKLSDCQVQWGWSLNVQYGPSTGEYADHCGVPLRHISKGWDAQIGGDYSGCIRADGHFFLIQINFDSESKSRSQPLQHFQTHFGFCAPGICSLQQVTHELVPQYAIHVADAQRLSMTMGTVEAWQWPQFLDRVYVDDSRNMTLREQLDEVRSQIQTMLLPIASLVIIATLCDSGHGKPQNHVGNGIDHGRPSIGRQITAFGRHFVHAFSMQRAWQELCSPSQGITVDFLRGIATLLLVSLHLEMAQNGSTNNALEGGSLFRISMCYRCVIIMTVLTLHLALGGEKKEGTSAKSTSASFQSVFKSCNLKLARKFLRHLPLMMLSVWWDHIGTRLAFPSQPIKYVDGTQSTVEGSLLTWTVHGSECLASYWTCVFRFFSVNWQVRDANERVLFCFGVLLLRVIGLSRITNWLMYIWAGAYYTIREFSPTDRIEWEDIHHQYFFGRDRYFFAKRLEVPAFLGLFLASQNLVKAIPQRFLTKRLGLILATGGWCWSSWINQDDPAQWCLARNVKKCLGDGPFVLGLSFLLSTGIPAMQLQPNKTQIDSTNTDTSDYSLIAMFILMMRFISRLSFCILVVEAPVTAYLLRGVTPSGLPLMRGIRVDPMWERLILGPGLLLVHILLAFLLFATVQRPVAVFLEPLLKAPLVDVLLQPLLPVYVAFLAYHSNEI